MNSRLVLPAGAPNVDVSTDLEFRNPLQVPKGSKIISTAWYDNSAGNKSNPNPAVEVLWGDQTWEEMQYSSIVWTAAAAK